MIKPMSNSWDSWANNCPIIEQTGDGKTVGRCWFGLKDQKCPRHGDVTPEVERYKETGKCTLEFKRNGEDE